MHGVMQGRKAPVKRILFGFGAMLWLAGCYPAFRTVQPKVDLVVQDLNGRPVENATFTLATYRYPFPTQRTTEFDRYETDSAGAVSISRRGKWQMEVLLPDGSNWYAWGYCIEKAGYRAIAVAETRFKEKLTIVLQPHPGSSQCKWPTAGEAYYGVKIVE
jgi:hypothetical protein